MSILVIRSKVKAAHVADVEAGIKRMFAAIEHAQPEGIRYASCQLADGVTYVAMLEVDEGVENTLPTVPEFREFQENLRTWLAEPPTTERFTVSGSYRLF